MTRVLDETIAEHGRPERLRSDNRPEFCPRQMLGWEEERKMTFMRILGLPWLSWDFDLFSDAEGGLNENRQYPCGLQKLNFFWRLILSMCLN